LKAHGDAVTAVIEEETQWTSITSSPGLFAIILIKKPIHEKTSSLHKKPPLRDGVLYHIIEIASILGK